VPPYFFSDLEIWVKTADQILASIARFAQRTLQAHGA